MLQVKMLLFGGTFDPPHNGHIALLKNCAEIVQPDEIRILPAGIPPHKSIKPASAEHRIAMCSIFCELLPNCTIDIRETERAGKSYTADTVRELREEYPNAELYLCIGSDMFLSFEAWHEHEYLLKEATLVVHLRQTEDEEQVLLQQLKFAEAGAEIILIQENFIELSSSKIRELCTKEGNVKPFLPPFVYEYIQGHNLYQEGERYRSDYSKRMREFGKSDT